MRTPKYLHGQRMRILSWQRLKSVKNCYGQDTSLLFFFFFKRDEDSVKLSFVLSIMFFKLLHPIHS